MRETIVAHVIQFPYPKSGWDAYEWDGHKAFVTPAAWHRYCEFHGRDKTVIIMSDDWALTWEAAKLIAIEIATGRRTYFSKPLNEDNASWRKVW